MKARTLLWIGVAWFLAPCAWILLAHVSGVHIHAHVAANPFLLSLHYFLLLGWIAPLGIGFYRLRKQR